MKQFKHLFTYLFFIFFSFQIKAQIQLPVGQTISNNNVGITNYTIPSGLTSISFSLKGGDGGGYRLAGSICDHLGEANGGGAATVEATYLIGETSEHLQAGGTLRSFTSLGGGYQNIPCLNVSATDYIAANGGGASALLYLPPDADPTDTNWYILAIAGGGGGAMITGLVVNKGKGANATELSDLVGSTTVFSGNCGPSELGWGYASRDGYGGAGYKCLNPAFVAEGAGQSMVSSFVDEGIGLIRVALKANTFFNQTGTLNPNAAPNFGGGDGFCGGGYGEFNSAINRGAGGGGGGFTGGAASNHFAGGGGGSFVALGFPTVSTKKTAGTDGGGSVEDENLANGKLIITANAAISPTAACKDKVLTVDANGAIPILTPSMVDNGSMVGTGTSISLTFLDNGVERNQLSFSCNNGLPVPTLVTLQAKDNNGLTSTCNSLITFQDTIAPTAICQSLPDTIYLNNQGNATLSATDIDNGSTDNCGFTLNLSKHLYTCDDVGTQTVKLFIIDYAGNKDSCTASVVVLDTVPPTPNFDRPDLMYEVYGGVTSLPTGSDNCIPYYACPTPEEPNRTCPSVVDGTTTDSLKYIGAGTYTITWTYTDVNNNTATQTERIINSSSVLYVDKDATAGTRTGLSWDNAFLAIQHALDIIDEHKIGSHVEIWVADGTYQPTKQVKTLVSGNAALPRDATFYVDQDNIRFYGGFSGLSGQKETSLSQRNPGLYPTIIDGDLGEMGNIHHLFVLDATTSNGGLTNSTVIDGFMLQNASALAEGLTYREGAGILIRGNDTPNAANPLIKNCIFKNNSARFGGAISNSAPVGNANPTISNCQFLQNSATILGGAIHSDAADGNANMHIFNCSFTDNIGGTGGGAISLMHESPEPYMDIVYPTITNCLFVNNGADHIAYDDGYCPDAVGDSFCDNPATFTNCTFSGATTRAVNVIGFNSGLDPIYFKNCIFWYNQQITNNTTATVIENSIVGDDTGTYAGNNSNINQNPLFADTMNNDFSIPPCSPAVNGGNNTAIDTFSMDLAGNPRTANVTVDMGAYEQQSSQITAPTVSDVYYFAAATATPLMATATGSLTWYDAATGGNIISTPTPSTTAIEIQEYWVSQTVSGCESSRVKITVTVGNIIYVDKDATSGGNSGTSWPNAFIDLQSALDTLSNRSYQEIMQIWVADGTYYPSKFNSKYSLESATLNVSFYINQDSVQLYGGFNGTETALNQRNSTNNTTILSGDLGVANTNTDNAYHVVYIDATTSTNKTISSATVIDGFTIQDGNSNGIGVDLGEGGAIHINGFSSIKVSPIIRNCIFKNNYSRIRGGAIMLDAAKCAMANPIIDNCLFLANEAFSNGGAIYVDGTEGVNTNPIISNCDFQQNTAYGASAIEIESQQNSTSLNPIISNCQFTQNRSTNNDAVIIFEAYISAQIVANLNHCIFRDNIGGMAVGLHSEITQSDLQFKAINCLFQNNGTSQIFYKNDNSGKIAADFINCTFSEASSQAININQFANNTSSINFKNCILWNNNALVGGLNQGDSDSNVYNNVGFQNCLVGDDTSNNYTGNNNNFNQNPLFVDAVNDNFNLDNCSPAINIGDNVAIDTFSTDLADNTRIFNQQIDLGAYEAQGSIQGPIAPTVSDLSYCIGETATALTATGTGTLTWYDAATADNIIATPIPTTINVGTQEYWVSQTANNCESSRAKITVTIYDCAQPCIETLILLRNDTTLNQGIHRASKNIISDSDIPSDSTIIFRAGESITLTAGFHTKAGSSFSAIISPCVSNFEETSAVSRSTFTDDHLGIKPSFDFKVYPTPFHYDATILLTLDTTAQQFDLGLYDLQGRLLQRWHPPLPLLPDQYQFQVETDLLVGAGIYIIRLQTEHGAHTSKLVKQH